MKEIINKPSQCFIIGKEYYYRKNLLSKNNFIGCIMINDTVKHKIKDSIKWINKLRRDYKSMQILPQPTNSELYPNMNYKESDWECEKMSLAEKIKEITLVWNVSYSERCEFIQKGICCWDDPKLLSFLKESKKKQIQERMIHMNQQNDILMYPRKSISNDFIDILKPKKYEFFFDVESFLSFDEKRELFTDKLKLSEPMIGIIGLIYCINGKYSYFKDFTIRKFKMKEENKIIKNFLQYLQYICKDEPIYLYHWGHAECKYIEYMKKIHPEFNYSQIHLIDILDYFRTQPIIVQGVFKFGLKSIGKALYNHNLIKTTWNDNDNGLDSMIQFKKACIDHKKRIPLKRNSIISEVIDYNRIDCQVLFEIIQLLRNIYL